MQNSIPSQKLPYGLVLILAMLISITPLAIDVYLPSFSQLSSYFDVGIDQIELTLSIYLLGFACGQLAGGPLSDRYGRKLFIFIGLGMYIFFSFWIAFSTQVESLWLGRLFQACGGGLAVVNTNAIVRDLYSGKEGAKIFSLISMIMMVAPMIAPAIGSLILYLASWKEIFIFLGLYASVVVGFIFKLPETSPMSKNSKPFENYAHIIKNKKALLFIFAGGFGFSGMFVFITKSSFMYMQYFGLTPFMFTLFFGLNVISLMITSRLNVSLLEKKEPFEILRMGVMMQFACALLLLIFSAHHSIYSVLILLMGYIGALGFIFANAISLVLEDFKPIAASANALYGVTGFLLSSILGLLASLFHENALWPIFLLMGTTSAISLSILWIISYRVFQKSSKSSSSS